MAADDEDSGTGASESTVDTASSGAPTCPHCEAPLYKRHCKYVCPQHGPIIDCSDPFR
ncbi:HVO_2523 family zinc finger protein [Natronolimnohabitans innermongolicus]|uniref:HVO_2523 family zinc finger protein n=1 Tax=Natronolimnohabitans innermongolicus TaxID=253107 RepID=UPI000A85E1A5|nr:HVO_2523 family zinc finger protein [Natronolimnohabitans innermongolicus]